MDLVIVEAPGKRRTWEKFIKKSLPGARVIATGGHICEFPARLFPLGINLLEQGKLDFGRRLKDKKAEEILAAVRRADGRIYIATDNDPEGGVIAYDIANLIGAKLRPAFSRCFRLISRSMGHRDLQVAIASAQPILSPATLSKLIDDTSEGRTRAIIDRLFGGTLSRHFGTPVGRVRSVVPGTVMLHSSARGREVVTAPVELGEIILTARSAQGGLPFLSRIAIKSDDSPEKIIRLCEISRKFGNRHLPGRVYMPQAAGAAIAPRYGDLRPFSTGDVVAYAGRHFGLRPHVVMDGLQRAYMRGDVSNAKTDSRIYSSDVASEVCRLGAACNLTGLSPAAAVEIDHTAKPEQGLYPICGSSHAEVSRMSKLIREDWHKTFPNHANQIIDPDPNPETVANLMTALVARRSFEASRDMAVEYGYWRGGSDVLGSGLSQQDCDVLEDLDWERETAKPVPWNRDLAAGIRVWPQETVILDMMMTEDLARPFTLPSHLKAIIEAGHLEIQNTRDMLARKNPFALPKLTKAGIEAIQKSPEIIWQPATARMIARAIRDEDGQARAQGGKDVEINVRRRMDLIWPKLPNDVFGIILHGAHPTASGAEIDQALEMVLMEIAQTDAKQTALDEAIAAI